MDKDSGLIHSLVTKAANVHDLTPAANLLHGYVEVAYADAGYQGIHKSTEMRGKKPCSTSPGAQGSCDHCRTPLRVR